MIIWFTLKHTFFFDVQHFSQRTETDFNQTTSTKQWKPEIIQQNCSSVVQKKRLKECLKKGWMIDKYIRKSA